MKYVSDSVISLQEALLVCPAQDTSSQSSGRMDSPTPSAGECTQTCLNDRALPVFKLFSPLCFQTALPRTHHLQTAWTRREIESWERNVSPWPNSSLQTVPQPTRTGSPTPSITCAWSASARSSAWWGIISNRLFLFFKVLNIFVKYFCFIFCMC